MNGKTIAFNLRNGVEYDENGITMATRELIDSLADIIEQLSVEIEEKQQHLDKLQKDNKDLEERVAIMSNGGWHDAKKDSPKETDCYIVRIDYGVGQMTTMREYINSEGKWLKSIEEKITHWMQLPEPPEEGGQE